jgi:hypothetical protein
MRSAREPRLTSRQAVVMTPKAEVLVVANRTAQSDELLETLRERSARGPASFTLLVPAAWEVGDPHGGRETALRRLKGALRRLRDAGLQVEGVLGDPDPALAVEQVWDPERFDEIIVSTLPARISNWLKLDLPSRVQRCTGRSVQHVVASEIGESEITTAPTDPQRRADLAENRP